MGTEESGFILPQRIDHYLALLCKQYGVTDNTELQRLLVNATVRVEEGAEFDGLDGGQNWHNVHLDIPEELFLTIFNKKDALANRIAEDLRKIANAVPHEHFGTVFFATQYTPDRDWRSDSGLLIKPKRSVAKIAENRIWKGGPFRIFLSHKTEVKQQTAKLKEELEQFGLSCFVAHEDIEPTQEWQSEIENALFSMDALVALMTEKFHESNWTDQEVGVAFGRGVPIISAKIARDPYGFIGKFQAIPCTWENLTENLLKILFQRYNERLIDSFIVAIQKCRNFDEGNKLAKILPLIKSISKEKAKQVAHAVYSNGETRYSFGFSGTKPKMYGLGIDHYFKEWTGEEYNMIETEEEDSIASIPNEIPF